MFEEPCDARCITTNGYVKKNGKGVMGRGVAKAMANLYPDAPAWLGRNLEKNGNHVGILRQPDLDDLIAYVNFPTKHHWRELADLDLIVRSCHELMTLISEQSWTKVLLPRPGCGNGCLPWNKVKETIEPILDDRVWVVTAPF